MKREMGACIVEIRGNYAAALTEDGRFVRIRNKEYQIGQTVCLKETKPFSARNRRLQGLTSMAAGLLLLVLGGFQGYQTPVGVVSLDVNPSIEYTINCFDRVLDVRAVNGDGETILEQIDESSLVYLSVGEAVEQTIETLRENGYLQQETENDIVLSASSYTTQHAERLAEQLNTRVSKQQDLTVTSVSVTREEVEQAHALGASAGKVRIVEQLEQSAKGDESFDRADWLDKPVRDILQKTQEQENPNPSSSGQQGGLETQSQSAPQEAPIATPDPRKPKSTVEPDDGQKQNTGKPKKSDGETSNPPQSGSGNPPHG